MPALTIVQPAPTHVPHAMTDSKLNELRARAESACAIIMRRIRGSEISDIGYVAILTCRDAAICAKALLEHHELLEDVTVYLFKGRWRVGGAWKRGLVGGRG